MSMKTAKYGTADPPFTPQSATRGVRELIKRMPLTGKIGMVIVATIIVTALVAFIWTPHDPLQARPEVSLSGSSLQYPMGTDQYGRDVLSTVMEGAQVALLVGIVAVSLAAIIGTPLGILAAMKRGWVEEIVMRSADIMLAFPALLLAIMTSAIMGASTLSAMLAIGLAAGPGFARVARAGTLQIMSSDFIAAARSAAQSELRIARRHVLPNIFALVIIQSSVTFALAILAEAALSFLGLGTPPPEPSWGRMLQSAQDYLSTAPHLAIWPGVAIAVAVLGFNLLGDGLRDVLDPKMRK